MLKPKHAPSCSGFTLIEALVVLAILMVVALLGIPTLITMLHRSKMEGTLRESAVLMQQARLEAIKRSRQSIVLADLLNHEVIAFVDDNPPNRALDPAERVLNRIRLPEGVDFAAPGAQPILDGFSLVDGPIFDIDGSVVETGAIRIGDVRGNFLEIRIDPAATARIEMRKFRGPMDTDWYAPGEGGEAWDWK